MTNRYLPYVVALLQALILFAAIRDLRFVAIFMIGTIATLIWMQMRQPHLGRNAICIIIVLLPSIALTAAVTISIFLGHLGSTASLGIALWLFLSWVVQPVFWGFSRLYHRRPPTFE
ncbi:hypothetical protein [Solilutibacter oculi]|uniref:hypothetical protein n=1 Tax=Solilutibacter oculi TaxID=2698682 RepID=UPI0013A63FB9|nr:hypothetical protein [Lysobacter oculi]